MNDLKLTAAQKELLKAQVIGPEQPGPILRDFHTVLDFVGPKGVEAAGKHNLLPISAINTLDAQLSRPLHLTLRRALLRSHPYLQGLHLLLRATGLTRVEGAGAKARLFVDPLARSSWDRLSPTEQYFNLLEAWLLIAEPGMIGEWGRGTFFMECLGEWLRIPAEGRTFDLADPGRIWLGRVGTTFAHLALMDLFGLVEVRHAQPAPQPWAPAGIGHTAFGDALFTLLWEGWLSERNQPDEDEEEEDEEAETFTLFGRWQALVQPYFPEWQANLELPRGTAQEGTYIFRVSLGKGVWRRIALAEDHTFDDLATAILRAINFHFDHLYEFRFRDRFGATLRVTDPRCDGDISADEYYLGEAGLHPGQAMVFHYDFGDNWRFDVKLERIDPPSPRAKLPKVVESHGKAPKQYGDLD